MLQATTVCEVGLFAQDTNNADIGQKQNKNNHLFRCSPRQTMRTLPMASLHTLRSILDNLGENHCPDTVAKLYELILNTDDTLAWTMISQVHPPFQVLR